MSQVIWILASITFVVGLFYLTTLLNKQRRAANSRRSSAVDLSVCRRAYRTPKGVKIQSEGEMSDTHLRQIDFALLNLFEIARRRGYVNRLEFDRYTIYIRNPQMYRAGIPCFLIRADEYDGSIFDLNAAVGIGEVAAPEYVLPDNSGFVLAYTDDMELLKECVHNGAEHIVLWENDLELYDRTAIHGDHENDGHPILT